jgi:hypothetical protein
VKKEINYPSIEKIIEYNIMVLHLIKVKKADKPEVRSRQKISEVIEECKTINGGIYDKATVLLKGLTQKHPFASGNRRTAFNSKKFRIQDNPKYARVMVGIREGYYLDTEIKEWIKNGKIREFKR